MAALGGHVVWHLLFGRDKVRESVLGFGFMLMLHMYARGDVL